MENKLEYIVLCNEDMKTKLLWWQEKGLSYTASGYGRKIPTSKMARIGNRWHRIYCVIFSNIGSCYVVVKGNKKYIREV